MPLLKLRVLVSKVEVSLWLLMRCANWLVTPARLPRKSLALSTRTRRLLIKLLAKYSAAEQKLSKA